MADIEYKTPQDVADEKRRKAESAAYDRAMVNTPPAPMPKPAASAPVKKMAKGGSVSSASKRADGCAQRGKTRGKIV